MKQRQAAGARDSESICGGRQRKKRNGRAAQLKTDGTPPL